MFLKIILYDLDYLNCGIITFYRKNMTIRRQQTASDRKGACSGDIPSYICTIINPKSNEP